MEYNIILCEKLCITKICIVFLNVNKDLHQSIYYEIYTNTFKFNTLHINMTSLKTVIMPGPTFYLLKGLRL